MSRYQNIVPRGNGNWHNIVCKTCVLNQNIQDTFPTNSTGVQCWPAFSSNKPKVFHSKKECRLWSQVSFILTSFYTFPFCKDRAKQKKNGCVFALQCSRTCGKPTLLKLTECRIKLCLNSHLDARILTIHGLAYINLKFRFGTRNAFMCFLGCLAACSATRSRANTPL